MTHQAAATITQERFKFWADDNWKHCSTPVVLVSVTHGNPLGRVIINTVQEVSNVQLRNLLKRAIEDLDEDISTKEGDGQ